MDNLRPSPRSEESFPLLLLFLEDTKSPRRGKRFFADKSRYDKITEGASNVLTQWPGHVSNCWLSACIFLVLFFIILLMLMAASVHPKIVPRCASSVLQENETKIYLVHYENVWQNHQIQAIEEIMENYPGIEIKLINLCNTTDSDKSVNELTIHKNKLRLKRKYHITLRNSTKISVVIENSTLPLQHAENKFQKLLDRHPGSISVRNDTVQNIFAYTPLGLTWRNLNLEQIEFAVRVLMLWEFGGLSFKLPNFSATNTTVPDRNQDIKVYNQYLFRKFSGLDNLIHGNLTSFMNLPVGVVNIDDQGLHMETKSSCHAYFGEMLANLRVANDTTAVETIIRNTLKTFCLAGAVDDEYCFRFLRS